MNTRNLLTVLILSVSTTTLLPSFAFASGGPEMKYVGPSASRTDVESLQRGARLFVSHCLNCHSAQYMRYNRLKDLNLTEDEIKQNLMFAADKIGEQMKVAFPAKDAKEWFGAVPPDLSVMTRSYSSARLAAYLRGFYRDDSRETGWNNLVSPNIGMPHVLHELSGVNNLVTTEFKVDGQALKSASQAEDKARALFIASQTMATLEHHTETSADGKHEHTYIVKTLGPSIPGSMSAAQYDVAVADLVNFLDYVAEPHKAKRIQIGILVLFLLSFLLVSAIWLKKEYWKDVH